MMYFPNPPYVPSSFLEPVPYPNASGEIRSPLPGLSYFYFSRNAQNVKNYSMQRAEAAEYLSAYWPYVGNCRKSG